MEVAGGDVVADGVAGDVGEGVGFGDVFGVAADDEGEFAFVVELRLGVFVDGDVVEGAGDGVWGLGEDGGVGWYLELEGVNGVVAAGFGVEDLRCIPLRAGGS